MNISKLNTLNEDIGESAIQEFLDSMQTTTEKRKPASFDSLIADGKFEEIQSRLQEWPIEIFVSAPKDKDEGISRGWICYIYSVAYLQFSVSYTKTDSWRRMGMVKDGETIGYLTVVSLKEEGYGKWITTSNYNKFIEIIENHMGESLSTITNGIIDYLDVDVKHLNMS